MFRNFDYVSAYTNGLQYISIVYIILKACLHVIISTQTNTELTCEPEHRLFMANKRQNFQKLDAHSFTIQGLIL